MPAAEGDVVRSANGPAERAAGLYPRAAVAHEHPASAEAGVRALSEGGNAVDAAVAVAFAACVTMPAWTTIAGSGFMLVDAGTGADPVAIEFPPRAPLAASADMYELETDEGRTAMMGVSAVAGDANLRGARAVGVPAVVAGLCEAQARFGRLPLARVLAPAVALARSGFAIDPDLQMQTLEVLGDLRGAGAEVRGTLLTPDGDPLTTREGSEEPALVVQPQLAATLEAIACDGADGFYRGAPGRAIVAEVQRRGGILTLEDLARVEPIVVRPLSIRAGDATVWTPTSPCGGWTELQMLGALARLDGMLDGASLFDLRSYLEVSRRCFADRFHFMGDPDHVDVPLELLLSDGYLDALAGEVAGALDGSSSARLPYPDAQPWLHYASRVPEAFARRFPALVPTPWQKASTSAAAGLGDSFETTHLCTGDEDGMVVSCTLTAAHSFGSRVLAAGVVLDDAMIWFNAAPGAANSIAPWKRPLVNMGPLLVRRDDGRVLALGAPGGRRIVSAVSQVASHWMRGDSVEQATARPRVDGSGGAVLAARRLEREQLARLRGYDLQLVEDRDRFCVAFARPVAVASRADGGWEAAVQPHVRACVAGL
jgi:gamma-glutamyltranspeptidase/glutathione hydrolase